MSFSGMDVEEVERLANRLDLQARAIAAVVGVVDHAVSGLTSVWMGEDVEVFGALWHRTHRPRAQSLAEELLGWGIALRHQVAQQRVTSSPGGESGQIASAPKGPTVATGRSAHDKRWVLEMAELSKAAYHDGTPPAGFHVVKAMEGPQGFAAVEYSYLKPDGTTGYVVAFRGSNDPSDWVLNNLTDKAGIGASQYKAAVDLAREIVSAHPDADVTFTGHSLGGGLAGVASIATGRPAVAFNAAEPGYSDLYYAMRGTYPSHFNFLEQAAGFEHLTPDVSGINSFRTSDDPLTGFEGMLDGRSSALGSSHTVDVAPSLVYLPIQAHGIDNVITSITDDRSSWWR